MTGSSEIHGLVGGCLEDGDLSKRICGRQRTASARGIKHYVLKIMCDILRLMEQCVLNSGSSGAQIGGKFHSQIFSSIII